MSIYKDQKRGTWYVSYAFKDLPSGRFRHKTKRGFKTQKDAKDWERESYCSVDNRSDKTFEELVTEWEENLQASKESRRCYSEHIKYRLQPLRNKKINDISSKDLIDWRIQLSFNDNFSTATKNSAISFVRSIFSYSAMIYGTSNPTGMLKRFKPTNKEILSEMQVWTPQEFDQFISAVDDKTYNLFFRFLFWTGCRRGEAIALQKDDIVGTKAYIRYSQRTQSEGLKPTKTKEKRWIDLDLELYSQIEKQLKTPGKYLFGGDTGLSCTAIARIFAKGIKDSGVKKIRVHDLRHSHATWLINNGVNIVAVSRRLGHADVEQTLKTYTHLLFESDQNMMNKINDFKETDVYSWDNFETKPEKSPMGNLQKARPKELIYAIIPAATIKTSNPVIRTVLLKGPCK